MKTGERRWKCRAVENEENQNRVSLRFPQPLEIAVRFPHSHRAGDCCLSNGENKPEKPEKGARQSASLNFTPSGSSWD